MIWTRPQTAIGKVDDRYTDSQNAKFSDLVSLVVVRKRTDPELFKQIAEHVFATATGEMPEAELRTI